MWVDGGPGALVQNGGPLRHRILRFVHIDEGLDPPQRIRVTSCRNTQTQLKGLGRSGRSTTGGLWYVVAKDVLHGCLDLRHVLRPGYHTGVLTLLWRIALQETHRWILEDFIGGIHFCGALDDQLRHSFRIRAVAPAFEQLKRPSLPRLCQFVHHHPAFHQARHHICGGCGRILRLGGPDFPQPLDVVLGVVVGFLRPVFDGYLVEFAVPKTPRLLSCGDIFVLLGHVDIETAPDDLSQVELTLFLRAGRWVAGHLTRGDTDEFLSGLGAGHEVLGVLVEDQFFDILQAGHFQTCELLKKHAHIVRNVVTHQEGLIVVEDLDEQFGQFIEVVDEREDLHGGVVDGVLKTDEFGEGIAWREQEGLGVQEADVADGGCRFGEVHQDSDFFKNVSRSFGHCLAWRWHKNMVGVGIPDGVLTTVSIPIRY